MLLPAISLEDQVSELRRELDMRHRLYPEWVAKGRLSQTRSRQQLDAMTAALRTVQNAAWRDRTARGLPAPEEWRPTS